LLLDRQVYAFIDWDTSRRGAWLGPIGAAKLKQHGTAAQLQAVYDLLGSKIAELFPGRVRVRLRFYHGWHHGNQPSKDRTGLTGIDPQRRRNGTVLLDLPEIADSLACGVILRDTLRVREDGLTEQKMVDTAVCADLLWLARGEASRKENVAFLVVSEDDDMMPAVIVAEQWGFWARILRLRDVNRCMTHARSCIHKL
jgi:hypothetical protein